MMLITPTLLNNFRYYMDYEGEKEADVRADFLRGLSRERSAPNEAMQRGIDFENEIQAYCEGAEAVGNIKEIGDICKGGMWQISVKKELGDFLIYGRVDVMKADHLYDIKNSKNYEIGKFQSSAQHRCYFYCCPDIPNFQYLVGFNNDWWAESYINHEGIEQELETMISEFTVYLKNDPEASKLYYEKWVSHGK